MESLKLASQYFFNGLHALDAGDLNEAESNLLKALGLAPDRPSILANLSTVCARLNRFPEALELIERALKYDKAQPLFWLQLGAVRLKLGQHEDALHSLAHALELNPELAEAYNSRGAALKELRRFEEALASYDAAIALKPGYAEAYSNRGMALKALTHLADALESCDRAISLRPDLAEAHNNRGTVLKELQRLEEALASYGRAIALKPDYAEAYSNRGTALTELGRFEEALASIDQAISLDPDSAEPYNNRGVALKEMKRLEEAILSYNRAIGLRPDFAEAYSNLGNALSELDRLDEALASYNKAISISPGYAEPRHNKGLLLLWIKDLESGFDLYRSRWDIKGSSGKLRGTGLPEWKGGSSAAKVLLWAEQGIGDEIFYASMLSLVSKDVSVTLSADRRLHGIFERSFPDLRLVDRSTQEQRSYHELEAQAASGDLGSLVGASMEKLKLRRYPFLVASGERKQELLASNALLSRKPVCGVAWRSANVKLGADKSISLSDLAPLLTTPGMTFINLQYGNVANEIDAVAEKFGVRVHVARNVDVFNDIDALLSLIDACDIVLTTSNVTAHLAGAIGKKAAVLVPKGRGRLWYWHDEAQSTWYPSLNLFSQGGDQEWNEAILQATDWIKRNI